MRETKRELLLYSFYDHTGIAKHLEDMAAKGWMMEKTGGAGWTYRRCEPRRLHFAVTYFPKASAYDPGPSEAQQTFQDFCREAGWELIVSAAQMQVFCNENEDPVPIETDAAVQVANIHRAMKRNFLIGQGCSLFLGIYLFIFTLWRIHSGAVDFFSSNANLLTLLCGLDLLLLSFVELTTYFRWYRRAKRAAALDGSFIPTRSHMRLQLGSLVFLLTLLLIWVVSSLLTSRSAGTTVLLSFLPVTLVILLTTLLTRAMKRRQLSARVNRTVTLAAAFLLSFALMGALIAVIFRLGSQGLLSDSPPVDTYEYRGHTWDIYADPLPLTVQDLVPNDYDGWSTQMRTNSSLFLTHIDATQRARVGDTGQPNLEYEIVVLKTPFLHELCKQDYIRWMTRWNDEFPRESWDEYRPADNEPWGAEEVYQWYSAGEARNQFLVCWPDRIVEIQFDWDWTLTPELIATASEKLKSA